MPITRRQFELEIDEKIEEWMWAIHRLLAEHKDEAFTEEELLEHYRPALSEQLSDDQRKLLKIRGLTDPFDVLTSEKWAFDLALEKLVDFGVVSKAEIRRSDYYAYRDELEGVL